MNFPDSVPLLDDVDAIVSHLEVSLASKNLTLSQKIQTLRELMASELGVNRVFHEACQNLTTRYTHESFDLPTTAIINARVLLADPNVLLRLRTDPLQEVVGGDIALRVSCIEELVKKNQTDILLKQVGYLNHWREGQAMIQGLVYLANPNQLFQVLMECIHNRFSHNGENHFGPSVYREETIDLLFSTVVSRATIPMFYRIATEFKNGPAAVGLPLEQFNRYHSSLVVRLTASQIKDELSDLIDISAPHEVHPESSAFFVEDATPPREEITQERGPFSLPVFNLPPVVAPSIESPPTRVLRSPLANNMPSFAPAPSSPQRRTGEAFSGQVSLPPRRDDSEDDSAAFDFGDEGV